MKTSILDGYIFYFLETLFNCQSLANVDLKIHLHIYKHKYYCTDGLMKRFHRTRYQVVIRPSLTIRNSIIRKGLPWRFTEWENRNYKTFWKAKHGQCIVRQLLGVPVVWDTGGTAVCQLARRQTTASISQVAIRLQQSWEQKIFRFKASIDHETGWKSLHVSQHWGSYLRPSFLELYTSW